MRAKTLLLTLVFGAISPGQSNPDLQLIHRTNAPPKVQTLRTIQRVYVSGEEDLEENAPPATGCPVGELKKVRQFTRTPDLAAGKVPARDENRPGTSPKGTPRHAFGQHVTADLKPYLEFEIQHRFQNKWQIVFNKDQADAVLTPARFSNRSMPFRISARYLALNDDQVGTIALVDRCYTSLLWIDRAGDRSFWRWPSQPNEQSQIAARLVKKLFAAYLRTAPALD